MMSTNPTQDKVPASETYKIKDLKAPWKLTYTTLTKLWSSRQGCFFLVLSGHDEDGDYEETAISYNVANNHGSECEENQFWMKTNDNLLVLTQELTKRKIIEPAGRTCPSGFINIPLYNFLLTPDEKNDSNN